MLKVNASATMNVLPLLFHQDFSLLMMNPKESLHVAKEMTAARMKMKNSITDIKSAAPEKSLSEKEGSAVKKVKDTAHNSVKDLDVNQRQTNTVAHQTTSGVHHRNNVSLMLIHAVTSHCLPAL